MSEFKEYLKKKKMFTTNTATPAVPDTAGAPVMGFRDANMLKAMKPTSQAQTDAYQRAVNDFIGSDYARSIRPALYNYAKTDEGKLPVLRNLTSNAAAAPKLGDVKSLNKKDVRTALMDQHALLASLIPTGVFDTDQFARGGYHEYISDNYLSTQLKRLEEELAASKQMDYDWANGGEAAWYDYNTRQTSVKNKIADMESRGINYYDTDQLTQDDILWFDHVVNGNASWTPNIGSQEDVDRLNALYEQWGSVDDWEAFDLATYLGIEAPTQYQSNTDELQYYRDVLNREYKRREEVRPYVEMALGLDDFDTLSQYVPVENYGADFDPLDKMLVSNYSGNALYDWINTGSVSQEFAQMDPMRTYTRNWSNLGYDWLYPDEKEYFTALYNSGDPASAQQFLNAMEPVLLQRRANYNEIMAGNWATGNWATAGVSWLGAGLSSLGNAAMYPLQALVAATGELDPNSALFDAKAYHDTVGTAQGQWLLENTDFKIAGKNVAKFAYDVLSTSRDTGAAIGAATFTAGATGLPQLASSLAMFIQGSNAASNTLQADIEAGWSQEGALLHSLAAGGVEALTEKYSIDVILSDPKSLGRKILQSMGTEAAEEGTAHLLEPLAEKLAADITGNYTSWHKQAMEMVAMGEYEDYDTAMKSIMNGWIAELPEVMLMGGLSGGLLGGVTGTAQTIGQGKVGKTVQSEGDVDAMLNIAGGMRSDSQSAEWARTLTEKKNKGKKISTYDVGRLTMAMESDLSEELAEAPNMVMDKAIEERLVELGEDSANAAKLAPVIRKMYRGQKINPAARMSVRWDNNAEQVVKELSRDVTEEDMGRAGTEWAAGAKTNAAMATLESGTRLYEFGKAKGTIKETAPRAVTKDDAPETVEAAASAAVEKSAAKVKVNKGTKVPSGKVRAVLFDADGSTVEGTSARFTEEGGKLKMTVDTEDGTKTIPVESVQSTEDAGLAAVAQYVEDSNNNAEGTHQMSAEEANAMMHVYEVEGGDAAKFISNFEKAYLDGYAGVEMAANDLSENAAKLAYDLGKKETEANEAKRVQRTQEAKAASRGTVAWLGTVTTNEQASGRGSEEALAEAMEGMSESQRSTVEVVQAFAQEFKTNVVLFESDAENIGRIRNGSFDAATNTIYIDINSGAYTAKDIQQQREQGTLGYAIMRTMGHELTHYLEYNSAEGYAKYKQAVKTALGNAGQGWAALVRSKIDVARRDGRKLTYAAAEAEVVADASEYMLQDSKFVEQIDNSVKGKIKRFIQNFMQKLQNAFRHLTEGHRESIALREMVDGVYHYTGDLQQLWDAAMEETMTYKARHAGEEVDEDSPVGKHYKAKHAGGESELLSYGEREWGMAARRAERARKKEQAEGTKAESNGEIRYSTRDAEYMQAVESGDMETAQRMVDEAAEEKMPESKLRTKDGKLRKVYHGTNAGEFYEFNPDYIGSSSGDDGFFGMGFYFAYSKGEASYYGAKRIISAYLDLKNPFDFEKEIRTLHGKRARGGYAPDAVALVNFANKFPEIAKKISITVAKGYGSDVERISAAEFARQFEDVLAKQSFEYQEMQDQWGNPETLVLADPEYHEYEYKGEIRKYKDYKFQRRFTGKPEELDVAYEYLSNAVYSYIDMPNFTRIILDYNREFTNELKRRGYDGTIQSEDGDEAVAFSPEQIKYAEPVTYDDYGDVVPLSERFNTESPDIRYSTRDLAGTIDIRDYLGNMKERPSMTETEKILLKRYQGTLKKLKEAEANAEEQWKIIKTVNAIGADGKTNNELTKAQNRWKIYRNQANRYSKILLATETDGGFARLMATSQEVLNRYLLGSAGNVADAADALDEEVKGLTKQLKAVEADVTRTYQAQRTAFARGLFDQQTLNRAAQKLKDAYGSRMSVKAIADRLALVYGEIYADNGAEGAKRFAEAAKELAYDILQGHKYRYKSETLPMLAEKIGTISLTETDMQEIKNAGMAISEYKKALAPWVKIAEGASDLSSVASNAMYYGDGALAAILGDDTEGNLAMNLYNYIQQEKAREQEIGVEGMSEGEMITAAMADIAGSDLPLSTNSKTAEYLRNEMKKFAGDSAVAAMNYEQMIMNAQKATDKASKVWRAAVKEVETARKAVEYYRALDEQRRIQDLKIQKQTVLEELKSDNAKKLYDKVREIRADYKAREESRREYRITKEEVNKLRRKIGRDIKRLNNLTVKASDKKHVPEDLKHLANIVMTIFTEGELSRLAFSADHAASLQRMYRILGESDNQAVHFYDEEMDKNIENLIAMQEQYTKLRNRDKQTGYVPSFFTKDGVLMQKEILTIVDNIVSNVLHMIDQENNSFIRGRQETFEAYANRTGENLVGREDHKVRKGALGKWQTILDESIRTGNMTPVYFFEHLQNPEIKAVFDEIRKGQSEYAKIIAEGKAYVQEMQAKHNYGKWVSDGKLKMKTGQGHTIELTREEAAELYALYKREQANKLYQTEHLLKGGFQYRNIAEKVSEDGKTRAKDNPHQLDAADMARISEWLTEEQKAYADALVGFLSTTMADYGNAASMSMYGYKKFTESYYIPFRTVAAQRMQKGDEGAKGADAGTGRLRNAGFTNKVQTKANATLYIGGITETVADHIHKMAAYSAMVQPIEDLKRLLNHKVVEGDGTTNTIRALIGQKYGQAAEDYISQLLKDLNGATQSDNRASAFTDKMISAFKRGAVMASASVVLQQPTAMARAMAYISPKYFAQNPFFRPSKSVWTEMMQYAGDAVIKDMGKFDIGMGLSATQYIMDEKLGVFETYRRLKADSKTKAGKAAFDRLIDRLTAAPGMADQWTWSIIWKAVKAEQAAENPGMDTASEAFLQKCGERFNDVIDHTQVYDSVLTKSNLMRSSNQLHKMATSFMSEPVLSLNMLYDAVMGKHGKKKGARIIGSVVASQVLAGAMAALVQAWNDDEDKRNWLEKYTDRATGNILSNINILGMIPYISDIVSMFEGYDVERPDMSAIADLIDYTKTFMKSFENGGPTWKQVENFAGTWANLLGIPAKNISREVRRTRNMIWNTDWSAPNMSNVGYVMMESLPGYSDKNTVYYDRIVAAELRGDEEEAEDLRTYMLTSKMVSEDKLTSGLKTAMKDRYIDGDVDEDTAMDFLISRGLVENEADAYDYVSKWEYSRDNGGSTKGWSRYLEYEQAIETGGQTLIDTTKMYLDQGVAKSTLKGRITEAYKKKLIDLHKSGKTREFADLQAKVLTAYQVLGYDRDECLKMIQKWLE